MRTYEIVGLTYEQMRELADVICGSALFCNQHAWPSMTCVARPEGCQCQHCQERDSTANNTEGE